MGSVATLASEVSDETTENNVVRENVVFGEPKLWEKWAISKI